MAQRRRAAIRCGDTFRKAVCKTVVTMTKRSDIPKDYTWDLESIFPTDDDWERAFQSVAPRVPELEALQGTLAQSGQALLHVLRERDDVYEQMETLFVYTSMRRDEDTANSKYQGMFDRSMQLFVRISTAFSFLEPEILALPQSTLDGFLRE